MRFLVWFPVMWITGYFVYCLNGRTDELMIGLQPGHWLTGLISAADSEILTTAHEQMGAITDISLFSSVCSVLVNICVAGGSRERGGKKSDGLNVKAKNTLNCTDGD